MNILSSLNMASTFANSNLFNGFKGMMHSSQQHQEASQDILDSTKLEISSSRDSVTLSSVTENISDSPNLERSVLQLNQAGITYTANARLVRATSSIYDALLRTVA
jgi:hypothetical protein